MTEFVTVKTEELASMKEGEDWEWFVLNECRNTEAGDTLEFQDKDLQTVMK